MAISQKSCTRAHTICSTPITTPQTVTHAHSKQARCLLQCTKNVGETQSKGGGAKRSHGLFYPRLPSRSSKQSQGAPAHPLARLGPATRRPQQNSKAPRAERIRGRARQAVPRHGPRRWILSWPQLLPCAGPLISRRIPLQPQTSQATSSRRIVRRVSRVHAPPVTAHERSTWRSIPVREHD